MHETWHLMNGWYWYLVIGNQYGMLWQFIDWAVIGLTWLFYNVLIACRFPYPMISLAVTILDTLCCRMWNLREHMTIGVLHIKKFSLIRLISLISAIRVTGLRFIQKCQKYDHQDRNCPLEHGFDAKAHVFEPYIIHEY